MKRKYPLYEHSREHLKTPGGHSVDTLSLDELRRGGIEGTELGIHPDTLRAQAEMASEAGFTQVAENLLRAAELARIADARILEIYDALRPGRATREQLEEIAKELEEVHRAPLNAAFIREAASAQE